MVRVESKKSSKVFQNFTLQSINTEVVNCCEDLTKVMREQLIEDIISHKFDIGYVQGTKV